MEALEMETALGKQLHDPIHSSLYFKTIFFLIHNNIMRWDVRGLCDYSLYDYVNSMINDGSRAGDILGTWA